ncbi:MAG: hypothetical protein MdMp014T_1392 [Treponematales bacterium]
MSIVKAITDRGIPPLVSKVRDSFDEYQRLRKYHDTFTGSLSSGILPLETKLRRFCAAIPEMQKEAAASMEASALLYNGLVKALDIGVQAKGLIREEIARLEKERAAAEAAERKRQEEERQRQEAERRRQEEEKARQEKEEKERREAATRAARKTTFCVVYWLCGIALAVTDIALLNNKVEMYSGLGLFLIIVFGGVAGVFVGSWGMDGGIGGGIGGVIIGVVGAIICDAILVHMRGVIGIIGGAVLWVPALIALFSSILDHGRHKWW